jgi:hypothetical protein
MEECAGTAPGGVAGWGSGGEGGGVFGMGFGQRQSRGRARAPPWVRSRGEAGTAKPNQRTSRLRMFLVRVPSATTAWIGRRARAERAGDLDGGASLTALAERDGVRATLVGARLTSRAFSGIVRRRRGGFARLSAQLCIGDASLSDQLDEREAQLVREQLVMRERSGRRWGLSHAPSRAGSVLAPHRISTRSVGAGTERARLA